MERSNSTASSTPARRSSISARSPLTVDEEYDRAFRSKSFLDLWSHAHRHVKHTFSSFKLYSKAGHVEEQQGLQDDDKRDEGAMQKSCSYTVLDDFVLEPSPEELARAGSRRRRHRNDVLLLEYFDMTQEACNACSALLAAIGATRRQHRKLHLLLLRLEGGGDDAAAEDDLARHVCLDNPLSQGSLAGFHDVHGRCGPLATRLAAALRRLRRLARLTRAARGAAAVALVGACTAAVVATLVLAAHAVVGIGVAAAAAGSCPAAAVRWAGKAAKKVTERHYTRAGAQVDAAARGAYIMGRDLDTMSRMVRRAHDELEHGRDVARIAIRGHGERPLVQEVVREVEDSEEELKKQLEELEEHICLCLITINRSRRLVAHEMTRSWSSPKTSSQS